MRRVDELHNAFEIVAKEASDSVQAAAAAAAIGRCSLRVGPEMLAPLAVPFALRHHHPSIAALVRRTVAHVADDDEVTILVVFLQADVAADVFVDVVGEGADQVVGVQALAVGLELGRGDWWGGVGGLVDLGEEVVDLGLHLDVAVDFALEVVAVEQGSLGACLSTDIDVFWLGRGTFPQYRFFSVRNVHFVQVDVRQFQIGFFDQVDLAQSTSVFSGFFVIKRPVFDGQIT